MNKGFIMDGYPRNSNDATAIFLEPISEDDNTRELPDYPGLQTNEKIIPQYVVIFEADDAYLKGRAKEISTEQHRQENHTEAQTDRRLKIYRENNPNVNDPKHLISMFQNLIGQNNCMVKVFGPIGEGKTA